MNLEIITKRPRGVARPVPILFVHGAWHGAWCWETFFMPYFAENGYITHAVSLRGHGGSDRPARFRLTRIADYVADVGWVVDRLPERPILIGHSMGGLVVQKYLEAQQVPGAVLLASVPVSGVWRTTCRIALRHPLAFLKANLTWRLYPVIGTPKLAREAFFGADIHPDVLDDYFSRLQDEAYMAFLDMMIFNLPQPQKVSTDLLILGAQDDTIFRPPEIHATAAAYGQKAQLFSAMAHDMMLEKGWQAIADRILAWLVEKGL